MPQVFDPSSAELDPPNTATMVAMSIATLVLLSVCGVVLWLSSTRSGDDAVSVQRPGNAGDPAAPQRQLKVHLVDSADGATLRAALSTPDAPGGDDSRPEIGQVVMIGADGMTAALGWAVAELRTAGGWDTVAVIDHRAGQGAGSETVPSLPDQPSFAP